MKLILAFILAWACTLSGVALGGFLVFRTKREGYDPLFQVKQPEGQVFNIEDGLGFGAPTASKVEFPREVQEAQDRFTEQFAQSLADKAGGK